MLRRTRLQRQADSKRLLRDVVRGFANLWSGTGTYTDRVPATDRMGRKVVVRITLEILPDWGSFPEQNGVRSREIASVASERNT